MGEGLGDRAQLQDPCGHRCGIQAQVSAKDKQRGVDAFIPEKLGRQGGLGKDQAGDKCGEREGDQTEMT